MWILKTAKNDLLWIVAPGLLGLLLVHFSPHEGMSLDIYTFIVLGLVDSGHTYTTALRTWLHPTERRTSRLYWIIPLGVFVAATMWVALRIPGLWMFVIYFGIYHSLRQYYGFLRWYERLNQRPDSYSRFFLYALCLLPFISRHFYSIPLGGFYNKADILFLPNPLLYKFFVYLYGFAIWAWTIYEISNWLRGIRELNRVLSIALPAVIFGFSFTVSSTSYDIIFPLLLSHGIAYIAVMTQTVPRVTPWLKDNFRRSCYWIGGLVLFCGLIQYILEDLLHLQSSFANQTQGYAWGRGIVVSIYLVPLLSHYIFDGFLWNRNHREAALIYA